MYVMISMKLSILFLTQVDIFQTSSSSVTLPKEEKLSSSSATTPEPPVDSSHQLTDEAINGSQQGIQVRSKEDFVVCTTMHCVGHVTDK